MVSGRRSSVAATTGAGVRPGTRRPASYGHPRCRERATCVLDPGHCEPPDGRWGHSSVPGCGPRSRVVRSSRADRRGEGKKRFCCVTTRGRGPLVSEQPGRCDFGPLAARALGLGVLGFGLGRPGDVWPAAAPPASGGPRAGIRDPGSSAGSSTAAGTCSRTLCAGRSAGAVGAVWRDERCFGLT